MTALVMSWVSEGRGEAGGEEHLLLYTFWWCNSNFSKLFIFCVGRLAAANKLRICLKT